MPSRSLSIIWADALAEFSLRHKLSPNDEHCCHPRTHIQSGYMHTGLYIDTPLPRLWQQVSIQHLPTSSPEQATVNVRICFNITALVLSLRKLSAQQSYQYLALLWPTDRPIIPPAPHKPSATLPESDHLSCGCLKLGKATTICPHPLLSSNPSHQHGTSRIKVSLEAPATRRHILSHLLHSIYASIQVLIPSDHNLLNTIRTLRCKLRLQARDNHPQTNTCMRGSLAPDGSNSLSSTASIQCSQANPQSKRPAKHYLFIT